MSQRQWCTLINRGERGVHSPADWLIAGEGEVRDHIKFLTAAESSTLLDAIGKQLAHEPLVETRNRKPLRPNPLAPWELRVGLLRAFYDVRPTDPKLEALADVVYVLAVGKKERHVLRIAGEVVKI